MIQIEEEREIRHFKTKKILQELCNFFGKGNISMIGITKEKNRQKGAEII